MLPTFFVIGAAKCGTTSLHAYLAEHPEIAMSRDKEPQLFAHPGYDESRLAVYGHLFRPGARARGESSTVYSQYPRWPGVPERIREHVPEARFIYLVRDPIERAVAHWAMHVAAGKESRPLSEALEDFERPDSLYVCPSRYATQLGRYLEQFEPERILVLDRDRLLRAPENVVAQVFSFLAVDPGFSSPAFRERLNVAEEQRAATAVGRRLWGTRSLEVARGIPVPARLRRRLRQIVSRPVERPALDDELRGRLADSLREEVTWLRAFAGQPFAGWSL